MEKLTKILLEESPGIGKEDKIFFKKNYHIMNTSQRSELKSILLDEAIRYERIKIYKLIIKDYLNNNLS